MAIVKIDSKSFKANVLCLDKDGLLFDSIVFWEALWKERLEQFSGIMGSTGIELWKSLCGVEPLDRFGPFALAYPQEEVVLAAAVLYKISGHPWNICTRLAEERFYQADQLLDLNLALKPLPGFPKVIEKAKKVGMKVAIVTSDDETRTDISLRHFGVRDMVDYICTPADVEHGKPHPDMLYKVGQILSCKANDMVMIGDSLVDVEMARNAGAKGIAIPDKTLLHLFKGYVFKESLDEIEFLES
jgi:phosphoglycolate phosphatase